MATDYGGTYGGQPWDHAQPRYSGHPPYGGPYYSGPPGWTPPPDPPPPPWFRRKRFLAIAALLLGGLGLVGFGAGAWVQVAPRKFTAAQQRQISDWELGKRWRDLPAGSIFPASLSYAPATALDDDPSLVLSAGRVGVAKQASCASAADPSVASVLDREGCLAMLRATYVDGTDSYVVTVGVAVLPGSGQATIASHALAGIVGPGTAVHTAPFNNTPAADFTDGRRQLSGVVSAGTYVVLYTVGYADSRPKEQVTADSYAEQEMTSAGVGVAHDVLSVLAAPVPPPRCPGAPGC